MEFKDILLLIRKKQDIDEAFKLLFERYNRYIKGLIYQYYNDVIDQTAWRGFLNELTNDLFSDVILPQINTFRGSEEGQFKSWLYVITRNYCIDILKHGNKKYIKQQEDTNTKQLTFKFATKHTAIVSIDDPDGKPIIIEPEEPDGNIDLIKLLNEAIQTLDEPSQKIIQLYFYENYRQAQISKILDIDTSNVCRKLKQISAILREKINENLSKIFK